MATQPAGLRGLLVGSDHSVAERLRRRRWSIVERHVPDLADLSVLDLGGTGLWWNRAPARPRHVTVVNLYDSVDSQPGITEVHGDALDAPSLLGGEHFDLVFSHSLIEHLGGHLQRRRFAEVVQSMAPRYVVQTPYRYFPVEPHWVFPGFQFMPVGVRSRLAPIWPLGHTKNWPATRATDEVMSTYLLSAFEMRDYFPGSELCWERIGGIPKSMYAIGCGGPR